MHAIIKYSLFFILIFNQLHAQLYINEVSQGNGGTPPSEYVELIVVGNKTCTDSCADIRGWILDDNMGVFGADGIAGGHVRFTYDPQWECIPYGSLIVLYNPANVFPGISPDPSDANGDDVYILPISSTLIDANTTVPPNGSSVASYGGSSYTAGGASWNSIGMRNGGDAIALFTPTNLSTAYHAITWGSATGSGIYISGSASGLTYVMTNSTSDNINSNANWGSAVSTSGTPGAPNTSANNTWINSMRTSPNDIPQTINATICQGQTYSFGGNNLTSAGTYNHTVTNPLGCDTIKTLYLTVNMGITVNISDSICQGQTYSFGGNVLTTAGIYNYTTSNQNGCDSTTVLTLSVNPNHNTTIYDTICQGYSYVFGSSVIATSGTHNITLANQFGCDSVITLYLTVIPSSFTILYDTICQGQTYFFGGALRTNTGAYLDTLVNQFGCDSVITLNLYVRPLVTENLYDTICAGDNYFFNGNTLSTQGTYIDTTTSTLGCDSIITLYLTVHNTYRDSIFDSICSGSFYFFNSRSIGDSGTYYDTLTSVNGCDSLLILFLKEIPVINDTIYQQICVGQSYNFGGLIISSAGAYHDTLTYSIGCDSISTLILSVQNTLRDTLQQTICSGQVYNFRGNTLTTSGIYQDTLLTTGGCDSITTLLLTVDSILRDTLNQTICFGQTYSFGGAIINTAGTYRDTILTIGGCDSISVLNLSITTIIRDTINQVICAGQSYTFGGSLLTISGTYQDTLSTIGGCDSISILNLSVATIIRDTISQTICSGQTYNFGGVPLSIAGTYSDTLLTTAGCDSISTLQLIVQNTLRDTLQQTICAGNSYSFGGNSLTISGIYNDTLLTSGGCDSISTLFLTVSATLRDSVYYSICQGDIFDYNGRLYQSTGEFNDTLVSSLGCDSIVHLFLTVNPNPSPQIVGDSVACDNTIQELLIQNSYSQYLWSTGDTTQLIEISVGDSYTVQVTNANGCFGYDTLQVNFENCDEYCTIFIPNAFTLNYDGLNDGFNPITTVECDFAEYEFLIYDRWGEKLFESITPGEQWDGTNKNEEVAINTYVWKLKYRLYNEVDVTSRIGHVNVLK